MLSPETQQYCDRGHVALAGLYPPVLLREFYHKMRADLNLDAGNPKFAGRGRLARSDAIEVYSGYYAPIIKLHWGLTERIARATGCDLLPTYAFFRQYGKDDICRVHSDRPACEHSVSLTIAYGDDIPWALSVADMPESARSGRVTDDFCGDPYTSLALQPGDGVLYQGVSRRHGRIVPNPNSWSAHLFLHWVDAAGPYRDLVFDGQKLPLPGR